MRLVLLLILRSACNAWSAASYAAACSVWGHEPANTDRQVCDVATANVRGWGVRYTF